MSVCVCVYMCIHVLDCNNATALVATKDRLMKMNDKRMFLYDPTSDDFMADVYKAQGHTAYGTITLINLIAVIPSITT